VYYHKNGANQPQLEIGKPEISFKKAEEREYYLPVKVIEELD
jgi:hypothetical protein